MKFSEIEEICKCNLTSSAYKYRAYWSNSPSHPLMKRVLEASWCTHKVDMKGQIVWFRRDESRQSHKSKTATISTRDSEPTSKNLSQGGSNKSKTATPAEFERDARDALAKLLGVELRSEKIDINGRDKSFDIVNKTQRIVGDVKKYRKTESGKRPSAKFSVLIEYVWLMQMVEKYSQSGKWRKLFVIGEDRVMLSDYVKEFDKWLADIEIYYFSYKGGGIEKVR